MDITTLGIGAIIGATLVAGTNLYIFTSNRRKDEIKECLKNLYYPLHAIIEKNYKSLLLKKNLCDEDFDHFASAYYEFFLELRDIYLDNKVYESKELNEAFHSLLHNHEIESLNYKRHNLDENIALKALAKFELKHEIDENGISEMERKIEKVIDVVYNDIRKLQKTIRIKSF